MENLESYLFLLKKFIGELLMPLPMTLLLLIWALLLLLRRKTRWFGILFVLLATGLLFVSSYAPLSAPLTAALERQYPSWQTSEAAVDYISVLGAGHGSAENLPITSELSPIGIVRLTEGIRIYRLNPGSKLIFTGYHAMDPASYADKITQLAVALGVPQQDILTFSGPKDTAEEAQLLAENFTDSSLVLVTTAAHMPRAMQLMQAAGLDPVAAPTNHMSKPVHNKWTFPTARTLAKNSYWLHEQLGLLWSKIIAKSKS